MERLVSRNLSTTDQHDNGAAARLVPLFGGLAVVVAWFGLMWNAHTSSIWMVLPRLGPTGAMVLLALGVGGVVLVVAQAARGRMEAKADLKVKEAELIDTQDRLRRYVADLERVADVAAHDLQEPLRRMVAYAQLLEGAEAGDIGEENRAYLGHVIEAARRMKLLVGGLRSFVAVDSLPVTPEVTSAGSALAVARRRLAHNLARADVALVVDPLPVVVADQSSLVEIFVQLLDNAIRFRADDRRAVIHVSAVRKGPMVTLAVSDNGPGIEPARVGRMFEIFYRPHGEDVRPGAGIGMGLAVVRRLVERLGGVVWLESKVGQGSSFCFALPLDPSLLDSGEEAKAA
jgi:light-regulated signal transduction histidine kinase (bacteriophytochrome)